MSSLSRLRTGIALLATLLVAMSLVFVGKASAATPPFEPDSTNEYGQINFYDAAGHQVTGGSVTDSPFALYAVASSDDPTVGHFQIAALYGYKPVSGVAPGNWSGEQLSNSTDFPVSGAPAAIANLGNDRPVVTIGANDLKLADLINDYPNTAPSGDPYFGLYQLRIALAGETKWWAADIQITGTTWTLVYPEVTAPTTAPTTTSLAVTPGDPETLATAGGTASPVTLTATVTANVAGTVQFTKNGDPLGDPVATSGGATNTATMTDIPDSPAVGAGPKTTTYGATFTPTDATTHDGSTATPVGHVVQNPAVGATTTALTADLASPQTLANIGDPASQVTLTATVTANVAGTVQFTKNDDPLGDPVATSGGATNTATMTDTPDVPSSSEVSKTTAYGATFTPTDLTTHSESSGTLSYVVKNPAAAVTMTTLAVSQDGLEGHDVSLNTTVQSSASPGTIPVGSVSWFDNASSTPLNSSPVAVDSTGNATFDLPAGIGAGAHSIVAVFTPTDPVLFAGSSSTAATFTTTPETVDTTLTLTVDPDSAAAGDPVTLTARIEAPTQQPSTDGFTTHAAPIIGGTVTFLDGTTTLGTASVDSSGVATFTIPAITAGAHSFSAQYSGSTGFAAASTTTVLSFTATAAPTGTTDTTGGTGATGATGGTLPNTGSSTVPLVALGIVLVLIGGSAVGVGRGAGRRKAVQS